MSDKEKNSKEQKKEGEKGNNEDSNPKLEENINQTALMKKGDYSIHVLIEEIKNLVSKKEDFLPRPIVKVITLGQTKRTVKPATDCDSYTFNEHMYFDAVDLPLETLDSAKVVIEAYDYHNSDRADYFGIFELDYEYIYSKKDHCVKNLWVALANPEAKDITKVNGYLKISVSVLSTEDEKIELKPCLEADSDCMIPPQIKISYKQLSIYIFKGEDFPDMDVIIGKERTVNKRCNGFIRCKYLGIEKETTVVDMVKDQICWNEVIEMPISIPAVSKRIVFTALDYNKAKNSLIGSFEISINDVFNKKYEDITCINIYGALKVEDQSDAANKMNENPEIGSRWKGRVYLKISVKDSDSPITGKFPIEDKALLEQADKCARKNLWSLYIKLMEAHFLPKKNAEFGVKIAIQGTSERFPNRQAKDKSITWNLCKTFALQTMTANLNELPDCLIYLTDSGGTEICFQRIKLSQFHLNDDILMIKLFPEPCTNLDQRMYHSGILKIRAKLFNRTIDPPDRCDTKEFKDVNENPTGQLTGLGDLLEGGGQTEDLGDTDDLEALLHKNNKPGVPQIQVPLENKNVGEFKHYTVVANVYMTRYLVSGDSNGMSDPYTEITMLGTKKSTSVKNKCVNGIWNEKIIFDNIFLNIENKSTWPVMLVTVKDKDVLTSDLLGYSYIWLSDTSYAINDTKHIRPRWSQLYLEKSNRAQGQILLSFYLFDAQNTGKCNLVNIEPETVPYSVEINALGLRELKPLGFIKIKKPFISFDLNSINVSSNIGEAYKPIQTQPNESGENPNINSVLKFNVNLPKDQIFIPEFQCNVYDHVLGGLINKLLGIFMINIKQIIKDTSEEYNKDYSETKKIEKLLEERAKEVGAISYYVLNKQDENDIVLNVMSENDTKEQDNRSDTISNNELESPLVDSTQRGLSGKQEKKYIELKNVKSDNVGTFLCKIPSDLSSPYKGNIDPQSIQNNKFNGDYFVIKPAFKNYTLYVKNEKKEKNEEANNGKGNVSSTDKEVSYLIEDKSQAPDDSLYFAVGFNKNDNPDRVKAQNLISNQVLDGTGVINTTVNLDTESERLLNNPNSTTVTAPDEDSANNKKHYRRIFGKELEKVSELNLGAPFTKCKLIRNKFEDSEVSIMDLFEGMRDEQNKIVKRYNAKEMEITNKLRASEQGELIDAIEDEKENKKNMEMSFDLKDYGFFKGLIRISTNEDFKKHEEFLKEIKKKYKNDLPKELGFLTNFEDISRNIMIKRSVIVRIYILELNNLATKDLFSESDPYVKILLGDKVLVNEKKNYKSDAKNAQWYKHYDVFAELPGSSKLKIQIFDYDPMFSDDFIGETSIDIEDRYFDNNWQALTHKPIEIRKLYNPDVATPQGEISMWMEIFDKNERLKMDVWNIQPMPKSQLELRFIVYETEEMENMDIEDTSDVYVLAYLDADKRHKTDIHYRCQTGQASFNWRMKIDCELPRKNYDLSIQVFDNDILARDDFICGARLNLHKLISDVNDLDTPLKLSKSYYKSLPEDKQNMKNIEFVNEDEDPNGEKFWIQTEKNGKKGGRVLCSLEVCPDWYATAYTVGKGRDSPNVNPYLPPPVGRIKFSLNPLTMFRQLVGPKMRKKVCCWLCCLLLILYLIFVIPYAVYFISGEIINPFNYVKGGSSDDDKKNSG